MEGHGAQKAEALRSSGMSDQLPGIRGSAEQKEKYIYTKYV